MRIHTYPSISIELILAEGEKQKSLLTSNMTYDLIGVINLLER